MGRAACQLFLIFRVRSSPVVVLARWALLPTFLALVNTQKVVCIAGDGSYQMNIQEMTTASYYGINVKVLIMNNSVLGMVHQWQNLFYDERYGETILPDLPDFVKVAEAYNWQAERVENP